MKLGIRVNIGEPEEQERSLEQVLTEVAEIGYDGVELCLDPGPPWGAREFQLFSPKLTDKDREEIVRLAKSAGVEIATVSTDWAWVYSQYCPLVAYWGRGMEIAKSDIEMGGQLGAKVVMVYFGWSKSDDWGEVRAMVTELAEAGKQHNVKVAFEGGIFDRIGLGGLDALAKLIDEVNSPWFGAYEHCYWPRGTMQPHEEIELLGDRIFCLHSSKLDHENVDYQKMCAALKKVGYDFYWVFEVEGMGRAVAEESKRGFDEIMAKYW